MTDATSTDVPVSLPNGHVVNEDKPMDDETTDSTTQDDPPRSSTPVIPMMTIQEVPNDDGEEGVKMKPVGHNRKGSSVSQLSVGGVTTSSCSLSRDNSFVADTVSLPLTLEQLKNDNSPHTASDPALQLTAHLSRDDLTDEQRHETLTKLLEEVVALKLEIVNLKEENEVLRRARSEMDDEINQLTENLFEEAYKMVNEAKGGKADAEKRLMDAAGQIEAMETKVSALNNLIHTKPSSSSTASPTTHKHKRTSVKKMIKKISRTKPKKISEQKEVEPAGLKEGELPTEEYKQFTEWLEKGLPLSTSSQDCCAFFREVQLMHIDPCLSFKNEQLSSKVKEAVVNNTIVIEPLLGSSLVDNEEATKRPCVLSEESAHPCSYRMKIADSASSDSDTWYYISSHVRNKIVAVCDFYLLVGYVQKGIVKKDSVDLYWQLARLRGSMSLAMLNLSFQDTCTPLS